MSKRSFSYKLWDRGSEEYQVFGKGDDKIVKLPKILLLSINVTVIF